VKILELKNIARKDVPIYYRRLYTATAVIEVIGRLQDVQLDFSIEQKPTGQKEILITLADEPDYPRAPLVSSLKKTIDELDIAGKLPG
jgi:hypothetical protein